MKTVHLICAARPNFMKIAPLYHALKKTDWCRPLVVWVRQHKDSNMSGDFLIEFGVPDEDLVRPTGDFYDVRPDAVVVAGDVNTSAHYAIKAARLGIPVVHLEAGLRSFDRSMPEEINRIVIDSIADLLLTPSADATKNLLREGRSFGIVEVGNIMIDTFEMLQPKIEGRRFSVPGKYAVVTLHRPSNVDSRERLIALIDEVYELAKVMRVVFATHPRTWNQLTAHDKLWLTEHSGITVTYPMPYIDFMAAVMDATIVITDSGGVQEETSYLGVPCATVRENTERPITISHGTNVLIRPDQIVSSAKKALAGEWKKGGPIPLWDGHTAERCVRALHTFLTSQTAKEVAK